MKHDPTNPFLPTIDTKSFQRLVGTEPSASDLSPYALPPIQQGAITPGFPDFDHDGVPDLFDCDMYDPARDGWFGDIYKAAKSFVTPNYSRASDRRSAARQTISTGIRAAKSFVTPNYSRASDRRSAARQTISRGTQAVSSFVSGGIRVAKEVYTPNYSRASDRRQTISRNIQAAKAFVTPDYPRAADRRSAVSAALSQIVTKPLKTISSYGAQTTAFVAQRPYQASVQQQQRGAGSSQSISWDDAKQQVFQDVTAAVTGAVMPRRPATTPPPEHRPTTPPQVRPTTQSVTPVRKAKKVVRTASSGGSGRPMGSPTHIRPKWTPGGLYEPGWEAIYEPDR